MISWFGESLRIVLLKLGDKSMLIHEDYSKMQINFEAFNIKLSTDRIHLQSYFKAKKENLNAFKDRYEDLLVQYTYTNEGIALESSIHDQPQDYSVRLYASEYCSAIILSHTFIESNMLRLCTLIAQETKTKLTVSNIKNSNIIDSTIEYLEITTNLSKQLIEQYKPLIGKVQKLRNCIIHDDCVCPSSDKFRKLSNGFRESDISYDENLGKIIFGSFGIAEYYLEHSYRFISDIITDLKSKDYLVKNTMKAFEGIVTDLPF